MAYTTLQGNSRRRLTSKLKKSGCQGDTVCAGYGQNFICTCTCKTGGKVTAYRHILTISPYNAPDYLKSYCVGLSTSRAGARLRSEMKGDLKVRKSKTCFGDRAFSVAGPRRWNNIPTFIRSASTLESFKSRLKAH